MAHTVSYLEWELKPIGFVAAGLFGVEDTFK
jgi:hypothetical protein